MHIFVLSLLVLLDPAKASKSRRVNLELETVLEFDKSNDIEFLKTVQQFIDKVKDTLTNNANVIQNDNNDYKFTDLLEKSIEIIKTFQDDEIRNVFKAIDEEVRKFNPKNTFENNIRRYLSNKLVKIKRSPIKNIHKNLDDLLRKLREDNEDRDDNFFINFVNTLYKKDSERKYVKLFNKLNAFRRSSRRSNVELKKIIEEIIRDILIKYSNLSDKSKTNIGSLLKEYIIKSSTIEDADDVRDAKKNSKASQKVSKEDEEETVIETKKENESLEYSKSKVKHETLAEDLTDSQDVFDDIDDKKETQKVNKKKKVTSTTEYEKPLKLRLKKKIKSQSDSMVITRTPKTSKKRKEISKNRVKLTHNVEYNSQSQSSKENKKLSHLRRKKTKTAPKLTHITLYPVTIEINKKRETKFRADVPDEKGIEIKSNEEKSTANEIITNHNVEINVLVKQDSKEREDKLPSTADKHTPLRYKLKKKPTSNILNSNLIKRADSSNAVLPTSSASFEYFGSLYKNKKKLPEKVVTHKKIIDITKATTARDMITATNKIDKVSARKTIAYNDEINRRANKGIDNHTVATKIIEDVTKNTVYDKSKVLDSLNDTTISPSNDNNIINNTVKFIAHNETDESNNNNVNVSSNIEVTTNENLVAISNSTNITTVTPATVEETTFDINNYLKNSEIQNEDAEKKKEIEKLMRDDLKNLFSIATNATTTEGFTDVFKELEDAFDLN